ncbi:ferritin-like domain-containing protein [Chitinophaga parva]|uniref:Ferritin-like domain-containing protein n=1 Tax=Chitinophaga parva TaxID=2169414 RepID=A0A2T7BGY3_9BACT|nr:DUF892 family protein [Chitinophaga parva]PUZ25532.1 ferritin-like domain-containing protein [Chitinophaga parva]
MKKNSPKKKKAKQQISADQQSRLQVYFSSMLAELYWGEQTFLDVLDTMSETSTSPELKDAFSQHRVQTREHVERLERVFAAMGMPAEPRQSIGLQGLFDEGWRVIDKAPTGSAERDVTLIIAAQKVEHYEIATYGSLVSLARTLKLDDVAAIQEDTLAEEDEADALLTEIAEAHINYEASQEPAGQVAG